MTIKNYEIKFWRNFLEADTIRRQEMVSNLPALKEFKKVLKDTDGGLVEIAFDTILYSLFDDLANEAATYYSKK